MRRETLRVLQMRGTFYAQVLKSTVHGECPVRHGVECVAAGPNVDATEFHGESRWRQPLREVREIRPQIRHRVDWPLDAAIDDKDLRCRPRRLQILGQAIPRRVAPVGLQDTTRLPRGAFRGHGHVHVEFSLSQSVPCIIYAQLPPGRKSLRCVVIVTPRGPAPAAIDITVAGTSYTIRCHQPLPVGASGSYTVIA